MIDGDANLVGPSNLEVHYQEFAVTTEMIPRKT